ncbi:MAG: ABC transporter ATP-binding protein [Burkholderiales bacterium]
MNEQVLNVVHLNKAFGKTEVLHDISLTVIKGEVYGLVGQNGAGKTTLLRLITGLMKPTGGSIRIHTEKNYVGYMPQSCRFDGGATVADTIRFFASIRKTDYKKSFLLCKRLELDTEKKVKHLSPGQQKKMQLVIAMTGEPDLYILDEPTAGLDPSAAYEMTNIKKSIHKDGKSILMSSHILQDMDEICTNIAILEKGNLIYSSELEGSYVIKTEPIPMRKYEILAKKYSLVGNENRTVLHVKTDGKGVSELVNELVVDSIRIFEVSSYNVKTIVQEQLQIRGEEQC